MDEAPVPSPREREIVDREHLRLLAIFYYVMGGMYVFFSCFGLLYVFFGIVMAASPHLFGQGRPQPDAVALTAIGLLFAGVGGAFVLAGWTFGGLTIYAGRSIQQRCRRTFTFVMAALSCFFFPFGTLLGVFTFLVLSRPSVARLYDGKRPDSDLVNQAPATRPQEYIDDEHLNLLAIFHYIVGGLIVAFSSIFIIHVVMGIVMVVDPESFRGPDGRPGAFPPFMGYFIAIFAGCFVLAGWAFGAATIYSGRCVRKRKRRLFSIIVAGINCAWLPFGTLLGVFTIVVLMRESVKRLYGA